MPWSWHLNHYFFGIIDAFALIRILILLGSLIGLNRHATGIFSYSPFLLAMDTISILLKVFGYVMDTFLLAS
jgi:hypothetical protein